MTSLTTASLQVNFTAESLADSRIILQQLTKRFDFEGKLRLRCFPENDVNFVASVGKVIKGNVFPQVFSESIKFSNSSKVALQYPNAYEVTINALNNIAMELVESPDGNYIQQISVRFSFDEESNSIIATDALNELRAVYGACFVAYKAHYLLLDYYPSIEAPFGGAYGISYGIGPLYAYNNKTVEVLDIELDLSDSQQWLEYAKITSKIVLDNKGTWEFPDSWNQTYTDNKQKDPEQKADYTDPGTFTGFSYEIDPNACFVDTRVHEIIYINSAGVLRYEDFNNGGDSYWAWYNPYFGDSTYDPKYECTWSDPPGGSKASNATEFQYDLNHTTWRDVFLTVDKKSLLAELQNEYPGITDSGKQRQ